MIHENDMFEQSKSEFLTTFKNFWFANVLRQAGIRKSYDISSHEIFKFLFLLFFISRIYIVF